MTAVFVPEILVGVLGGLIIAMLAVLGLQLSSQRRIAKLTYPAYEYALQQAEHDATEVLQKAQLQAREILTKAETSARADIAKRQDAIESANEAYFKELEQLHASMHQHLEQVAQAGVKSLTHASEEIAEHTKKQAAALHEFTDTTKADWQDVLQRTTDTLGRHATTAEEAMQALVKQTTTALEKAQIEQREVLKAHLAALMAEAKSEVTEYRQQRQQLIETHIADMVADVTAEVLHTTLASPEHATLARTALAAAKQKHLL